MCSPRPVRRVALRAVGGRPPVRPSSCGRRSALRASRRLVIMPAARRSPEATGRAPLALALVLSGPRGPDGGKQLAPRGAIFALVLVSLRAGRERAPARSSASSSSRPSLLSSAVFVVFAARRRWRVVAGAAAVGPSGRRRVCSSSAGGAPRLSRARAAAQPDDLRAGYAVPPSFARSTPSSCSARAGALGPRDRRWPPWPVWAARGRAVVWRGPLDPGGVSTSASRAHGGDALVSPYLQSPRPLRPHHSRVAGGRVLARARWGRRLGRVSASSSAILWPHCLVRSGRSSPGSRRCRSCSGSVLLGWVVLDTWRADFSPRLTMENLTHAFAAIACTHAVSRERPSGLTLAAAVLAAKRAGPGLASLAELRPESIEVHRGTMPLACSAMPLLAIGAALGSRFVARRRGNGAPPRRSFPCWGSACWRRRPICSSTCSTRTAPAAASRRRDLGITETCRHLRPWMWLDPSGSAFF